VASPISIIINAQNSASGALGGLVNSITGVSGAVRTAQRDFDTWSQRVNSAQSNVNDLRTRLDTLRSMGVSPSSQAFRDLSTQLGAAEAHLRTMQSGAATSEAALRRTQAAAEGTARAFQTMGNVALGAVVGVAALGAAATAIAVGGFALAIKEAAGFENTLGKVQAAANPTTEELRQMRVEAMKIGPQFGKSADETVSAMGELAKSGMSMTDVLGGGAKAVVALAVAGGEAITPMAELLSKSLSLFRDTGLTATQAADQIAKTANASAIGIGQFGLSLAAVGPVAAQAGLDFEQMSTAIGILGNNALVGSDAGTSLKTMLLSLTAPSKDATKVLDALGVSAFNLADGSMKDFRTILGELEISMQGLTDQERSGALKDIFGTDAIRAANILLKEGVAGWDAFTEQMRLAPSVTDQASTRMGTLTGTIDMLKASFSNLLILGGTPFIGMLQLILGRINSLVSGFDIGRADAMSNALKGLLSAGDPEKRIEFFNQLSDAIGNPRLAEGIAIVTSGIAGIGEILLNGDWEGGSARVRDAISQLTSKFDVPSMLSNAKASIGEFFAGLSPIFTEYGPTIAAELMVWTHELWKWVEPAVGPVLIELGKLGDAIMTKLATELPPKIVDALGKTTIAVVNWISTGFGPAVLKEFGRQKDIIVDGLVNWDFGKVGESWFASIVAGLARAAWNFNPLGIVMNAAGAVGQAAGNAAADAAFGPVQGPKLPGNAEGTDFWKGGLTWVGERGPELLNLPTGSQIMSNQRSMATMSNAMQSVNLGGISLSLAVNGGNGGGATSAQDVINAAIPQVIEAISNLMEQAQLQVAT